MAWVDPSITTSFTDANWGPQNASKPNPTHPQTISLESTRSLYGYINFRSCGPISWGVFREKETSRSSCEAEIKAVDEATKSILELRHISSDLNLPEIQTPTPMYNDNQGTIDWSHTHSISKKLRHLNIRENAVRDSIMAKTIALQHIEGKKNPADLFTKEHKDSHHFIALRDCVVSPRVRGGC